MAAAVSQPRIEPTRPGKYPIVIGEDLLRETQPRKRQRFSVQYNHKPATLSGQDALLKKSKDGGDTAFELSIRSAHDTGKYIYHGTQKPLDSLALVYNPAMQSFVLKRLDATFRFNLGSAPDNKDESSLASQYPQLEPEEPTKDGDDLFGEEQDAQDTDEAPPDPDNPYDYRHFLQAEASPSPQNSRISSPKPNHAFHSSPLLQASSPVQRPRSVTEPKKSTRPRQRYLSPHPREEADADNEASDPNELVIDMGDDVPVHKSKPWRSALGALNEGGRGSGPISFRSAASSMSPSIRGESDDEKDHRGDHDVEEIDLGEPASPKATHKDTVDDGDGLDEDDEDLLTAELEQAMEAQQAEDQDNLESVEQDVAAESSEESEEE